MCGLLSAVVATRADAVAFNVALTLSPSRIQAGTTQTTTATATVTYNGVGQPNQWVKISTNGDATPQSQECFTAGTAGTCPVTLHAGTTSGYQTVTAAIDSSMNGGTITGSTTQQLLQYYPAQHIAESISPSNALTADGISTVTVTATVTDNATPPHGSIGQAVTISTTDPKVLFTPVTDNGDGTYTTTMSAIPGAAATDTVTAAVASAGLSAPQTVSLTNPAPRVVGPLSTSGNQILDGNGNALVPKGIDAVNFGAQSSNENDPTGFYGQTNPGLLTPAAVGNLYRWGVNTVRLMLSTDLYLQNCGETYPVTKDVYDADVQKEVRLITSFGMVAVVDQHVVNPKNANGSCYYPPTAAGSPNTGFSKYGGAAPLPPAADAAAFFQDLASHLGGNNLVAFELYNEPAICEVTPATGGQPQTDAVWTNQCPQTSADLGWANDGTFASQGSNLGPPITYSAAGMHSLYNAVRQNGAPNNLVFVDSNRFADDSHSFDSVCATAGCAWQGSPTNLVYVFHEYLCGPDGSTPTQADCSNATPETWETIDANLDLKLADRNQWNAPVDFNEFSWPQKPYETSYVNTNNNNTPFQPCAKAGLYVNNVIAHLDTLGIGYGLFAYENVPGVHQPWIGPYGTVAAGDTVPWTPSDNATPAVHDMQGTAAQSTDTCPS